MLRSPGGMLFSNSIRKNKNCVFCQYLATQEILSGELPTKRFAPNKGPIFWKIAFFPSPSPTFQKRPCVSKIFGEGASAAKFDSNDLSVPVPDISHLVLKAVGEQDLLREKSCRAVIGSFPERSTDGETASNDVNMVTNLASGAGLLDSLVKENIHKHGLRKESRPRIIKVHFKDVRSRDEFTRQFNRLRLSEVKFPNPSATCRGNLSPSQR